MLLTVNFCKLQDQHSLATVAQVVLRAAVAAIGIAFAYQVTLSNSIYAFL